MSLSHFDEKSGIVACSCKFGRWYQTVDFVYIDIHLSRKARAKELKIVLKTNTINCSLLDTTLLQGDLFWMIHAADSTWTLEEGQMVHIMLSKTKKKNEDLLWEALFKDYRFAPDQITLHEMRKKFDLEKFQTEIPSMDFSQARLQKCYDSP